MAAKGRTRCALPGPAAFVHSDLFHRSSPARSGNPLTEIDVGSGFEVASSGEISLPPEDKRIGRNGLIVAVQCSSNANEERDGSIDPLVHDPRDDRASDDYPVGGPACFDGLLRRGDPDTDEHR